MPNVQNKIMYWKMPKHNCRNDFFLFFVFSWSVRLQSSNSLRPQHMCMMTLIHTQRTIGLSRKNTKAFGGKTKQVLTGKTQQLLSGKAQQLLTTKTQQLQQENSYLCTYDLYGPVRNAFYAGSLHYEGACGRGLGPGN